MIQYSNNHKKQLLTFTPFQRLVDKSIRYKNKSEQDVFEFGSFNFKPDVSAVSSTQQSRSYQNSGQKILLRGSWRHDAFKGASPFHILNHRKHSNAKGNEPL